MIPYRTFTVTHTVVGSLSVGINWLTNTPTLRGCLHRQKLHVGSSGFLQFHIVVTVICLGVWLLINNLSNPKIMSKEVTVSHLNSSPFLGRSVQDVIRSALHRAGAAVPGSLAEPAGGPAQ